MPSFSADRFSLNRLLAVGLAIVALAAQAAPPAIIFAPTDHSAQVGISGPTATRVGIPFGHVWDSARSDTAQSVGVRTIQIHIDEIGPTGVIIGVASGAESVINYVGVDAFGVGYRNVGNVMKGGVWANPSPLPPTFTTGDTVGMQVDLTAHTVKFNKGGGAWSGTVDIASLGPDVFVAVSLGSSATGQAASSITVTYDNWNDYTEPTISIIGHGDSLSNIAGVQRGYLPLLADLIEANRVGWARWTRAGINGASWNFAWSQAGYPYTLTQDIPLRVVPALSPCLPNWVIAWAGTNGEALAFHSVATEYADLQADVRALIAAGVPPNRIMVPTMLPRTGVPETWRTAYNAAIVGDAGGLGYIVAPFHLDPTYGVAGANTDPLKYPDGIHPVEAAHSVFAAILYALMFP